MYTNNVMEKDKKKTLTISSSLKKENDTSAISSGTKKIILVEKKKPFKNSKTFNKSNISDNRNEQDEKKRNFTRKFIEQKATKDFIKKR